MTKGKAIGSAVGAGVLGLGALFLAFRPAAKQEPPCSPWPSCYAVSTSAPTLAPLPTSTPLPIPSATTVVTAPTPTAPASGTATPSGTTSGCVASVVGSFSAPGGKFPTGYADSLAIAGGHLLVREAYGYSVYTLDGQRINTVDLEGRPGYTRTGDGQQTVVALGASEDGVAIVAGWKTSEHGTLWLSAFGGNVGEWPPPRALGGVGVVQVGTRYVGLALASDALYAAPLVGTGRMARTAIGPGGVERSLFTSGRLAAYVTVTGSLVMVTDGTSTQTAQLAASAVAIEGEKVLIGVRNGYRLIGGDVIALPETPSVVTLLGGHVLAALSDGLYCDGARVIAVPWSPRVMRGSGSLLYIGDGASVRIVRVGP